MKRMLGFVLLVAMPLAAGAQYVLLDRESENTYEWNNYGPNRLHYVQYVADYGFAMSQDNDIPVRDFLSGSCVSSLRYKIKIASPLAICWEAGLGLHTLRLKDAAANGIITPPDARRSSFRFLSLTGAFLVRITPFRHGDELSVYFDAGMYESYIFDAWLVSIAQAEHDEGNTQVTVRTSQRALSMLNRYNWGYKFRLGYETMAFTMSIRESRLENMGLSADLPRVVFGIELGLY